MRRYVSRWMLGACCALCAGAGIGQRRSNPSEGERLQRFLRGYLAASQAAADETTRISVASLDWNSRRKITWVYVSGADWCGSGGCTLLTLEARGHLYRVLGRTSIVQLPVVALSTQSNGLPDIEVHVEGGGIQPGYEALLSFHGRRYPSNPSMAPAKRLPHPRDGRILISKNATGVLLYEHR